MPWFGRRRKEAVDGSGVEGATTRTEQANADQSADADGFELESPALPSVDGPLDASVRVIDTNPAHANRKLGR